MPYFIRKDSNCQGLSIPIYRWISVKDNRGYLVLNIFMEIYEEQEIISEASRAQTLIKCILGSRKDRDSGNTMGLALGKDSGNTMGLAPGK